MTAAHDRSMDTEPSPMQLRDSRTSEVRALAPRRRSLPPRPEMSVTRTARRSAAPMLTVTTDSRPAPPRPTVSKPHANAVAKRSGPPPLPTACEPEAPPAWDASEETDATEWQDVSEYVSVPPPAMDSPPCRGALSSELDGALVFRDGPAARLAVIARAASKLVLTGALFARYVVVDVARFVARALPPPRALVARMHVQWTRAAERAQSNGT